MTRRRASIRRNPGTRDTESKGQARERNEPGKEVIILAVKDILLTTQLALDLVEVRYTLLFTAVRELGNLFQSKDVLEHPRLVKKLKQKANRDREQASQAVLLALEQKDELRKKKEYIRKIEAHIQKQELHIQKQGQLIQQAEKTWMPNRAGRNH
jgi:hypothetical protein